MNNSSITNPHTASYRILSGSFLKIFAIVIMFIDHFAAGFILPSIITGDMDRWLSFLNIEPSVDLEIQIYLFLRGVGRQAFPIFCFLLVEGFMHTRNKAKYCISLSIFGLISEIPFDYTLIAYKAYGSLDFVSIYNEYQTKMWESQNVYFTLALGLIAMWAADTILIKLKSKNTMLASILSLIPFALAGTLAYYINTDYAAYGITVIAIMYYFHSISILATLISYIFLCFTMSTAINGGMEEWSFPAFIMLNLYSGKRGCIGRNFKYFFYIFYPAHLILIFFLRYWILH